MGDIRCSYPLFRARYFSAVPELSLGGNEQSAGCDHDPLQSGKNGDEECESVGLNSSAMAKLNLKMLAKGDGPPTEVGARRHKMAQYEKKCSKILEGLFVGGEFPARDLATLEAHGITHVINCAGGIYPPFHPNKFTYKTLYLEDVPTENILCILHECFDFIDEARMNGGKVLVHCSQGVSRSASVSIAYCIWKLNKDFDVIIDYVKKIRTVISPNMGFQLELLQWQKRRRFGVKRCYISRLAPQSEAVPLFVVPKAVKDNDWSALDSRGVFIVEIPGRLFVWVGGLAHEALIAAASLIATRISRYDYTCNVAMDAIDEGQEPEALCSALNPPDASASPEHVYPRRNESYNADFDLLNAAMPPSRSPRLHGVGGADAVWGPGRILSCEATPRTPRAGSRSVVTATQVGTGTGTKPNTSPVPPLPLGICNLADAALSSRTLPLSAASRTPRTAH